MYSQRYTPSPFDPLSEADLLKTSSLNDSVFSPINLPRSSFGSGKLSGLEAMDTKQIYDRLNRLNHPFDTRGSQFDMKAPTYGVPLSDYRSVPPLPPIPPLSSIPPVPNRSYGRIPTDNLYGNSGADLLMRGPFDQQLGSQRINRTSLLDRIRGQNIKQRMYDINELFPNQFNPRNPPFDMRVPSNASYGLNSDSLYADPSVHHSREPSYYGTDHRMGDRGMRDRSDMFAELHRRHRSFSNSSSSDSDTKCKKKCNKKGRHFKHWQQMSYLMSDPNWTKVECTLCWRQIRPLVETEVLECGHIYHRLCLKELFAVSQREDKSGVFCTQCRFQVDTDLVTEFKNRFNDEPTTDPQNSSKEEMTKDMKNLKVK